MSEWSDNWEEVRPLGRSGQGYVREVIAKDGTNRRGALKTLLADDDDKARERMHLEVEALRVLSRQENCRVPAVLDSNASFYASADVSLYLVMEFIDGRTLDQCIDDDGAMEWERSFDIALDFCRTMKIAHNRGILHRDIKPTNLIIPHDCDSHLYVVDFGLSFNEEASQDITSTGDQIKNSFWRLPEHTHPGQRGDNRSDVSGIAAVLFYCLTASVPVEPRDEHGRPPHKRNETVFDRFNLAARTKAYISAMWGTAFAVSRDDRFQCVADLEERLKALRDRPENLPPPDLAQAARTAADDILRRHRPTQLATFRDNAQPLRSKLVHYINDEAGRMGRFNVSAVDAQPSMPRPPNADEVLLPMMQQFRISNHEFSHIVLYTIIADGPDCVLMRATFMAENRFEKLRILSDWIEVVRFHGFSEPSNEVLVAACEDCAHCASEAIDGLRRELLSRNDLDAE